MTVNDQGRVQDNHIQQDFLFSVAIFVITSSMSNSVIDGSLEILVPSHNNRSMDDSEHLSTNFSVSLGRLP